MSNMKKWYAAAMGFGILGLASACSVDASSLEAEQTDSTQQALVCENQDGVNAYMAALAAATGREIGRWIPARDFTWNNSTWRLELTSYGKRRCDDGKCFNVQELLNMQNPAANNLVVFPGGERLNTGALSSRLKANWDRQFTCSNRPDNHTGDDCPAEYHELTLIKIASGACDKVFTFKATATDNVSALTEPNQLKNNLVWAGQGLAGSASNPYLAFQSTASTVSIDPTIGLSEGDSTTNGACTAACTMISSVSVAGQCCSCNGVLKTYARSPWSASTYLCK